MRSIVRVALLKEAHHTTHVKMVSLNGARVVFVLTNCCMQDESMIRYVSPVNPAVYPHLAVTLLVIGLFFTAWFFVYPIYTA